jgi:hypothetical protein
MILLQKALSLAFALLGVESLSFLPLGVDLAEAGLLGVELFFLVFVDGVVVELYTLTKAGALYLRIGV